MPGGTSPHQLNRDYGGIRQTTATAGETQAGDDTTTTGTPPHGGGAHDTDTECGSQEGDGHDGTDGHGAARTAPHLAPTATGPHTESHGTDPTTTWAHYPDTGTDIKSPHQGTTEDTGKAGPHQGATDTHLPGILCYGERPRVHHDGDPRHP